MNKRCSNHEVQMRARNLENSNLAYASGFFLSTRFQEKSIVGDAGCFYEVQMRFLRTGIGAFCIKGLFYKKIGWMILQ